MRAVDTNAVSEPFLQECDQANQAEGVEHIDSAVRPHMTRIRGSPTLPAGPTSKHISPKFEASAPESIPRVDVAVAESGALRKHC